MITVRMHQGTLALGLSFFTFTKNTLFYVLFLSRMNLFLPLVVQKTLRNINIHIMLSYNNNFYIIYICVRIHVQNHTHTHTFTLYKIAF